jgi:hypothetical protein
MVSKLPEMRTTACLALSLASLGFAMPVRGQAAEPPEIQKLWKSREKAEEELRRFPTQEFPEIERALYESKTVVGIVRINDFARDKTGVFTLHLQVEKTLRGTLPESLAVRSAWYDGSQMRLGRPPFAWDRIQPEAGKRVVSGLYLEQGELRGLATLDLGKPDEAKFLPAVEEFLRVESQAERGDISGLIGLLLHEFWFVRSLAISRLSTSKLCSADSSCQEAILASIRRELTSKNPNERRLAVNSLTILVEARRNPWRTQSSIPPFKAGRIRQLLNLAVSDANAAVGDEAFYTRATLDFDRKENAGYCFAITPALREIKRYPFGEQHTIGGAFNAGSFCIGAIRPGPGRKASGASPPHQNKESYNHPRCVGRQ